MKVSMKDVLRELQRRGDVRFGDEKPVAQMYKTMLEFYKYQRKLFNKYKTELESLLSQIPKDALLQSKGYKEVQENYYDILDEFDSKENVAKRGYAEAKNTQFSRNVNFSTNSDKAIEVLKKVISLLKRQQRLTQDNALKTGKELHKVRKEVHEIGGNPSMQMSTNFSQLQSFDSAVERWINKMIRGFESDISDLKFSGKIGSIKLGKKCY